MKRICMCLVFLILSCKSKEDIILDKFYGQWEIEEIKYNNIDYKEDLYINFIVFEKNNKISIPESIHFEKDKVAEWKINLDNNKIISINCIDEVFNGLYNVKFIKDENRKLLGIEMNSDSTYIRCYKFFQNYDLYKRDW